MSKIYKKRSWQSREYLAKTLSSSDVGTTILPFYAEGANTARSLCELVVGLGYRIIVKCATSIKYGFNLTPLFIPLELHAPRSLV